MDYRGKIIDVTPDSSMPSLEYLCTAHYGGHVEYVPLVRGGERFCVPPMPIVGPAAITIVNVREPLDSEIADIRERLEKKSKERHTPTIMDFGDDPNVSINTNLERVRSLSKNNFVEQCDRATLHTDLFDRIFDLTGRQTIHDEIMLDVDNILSSGNAFGSNAVFADIYGGYNCGEEGCCPQSKVGKLAVLETPLAWGGDSGEYIIVAESEDSLYGVSTFDVVAGLTVNRFQITPDEDGDCVKVLDYYEDDGFIESFIQRLQNLVQGQFDADADVNELHKDAARTVIRQLERVLEDNIVFTDDELDDYEVMLAFNFGGTKTGRFQSAEPNL